MAKTQVKGFDVGDGSVGRVDLNTTVSGQAVIRKISQAANSGIKIKSSSGVDTGTGDVELEIDTVVLDERYGSGGSSAYEFWQLMGTVPIMEGNSLYNWFVGVDARGIAPTGWHVPTNNEFETLRSYLGGMDAAGIALREAGFVHWDPENTVATNSSGFTMLPTGLRYNFNGNDVFDSKRIVGMLWSSTAFDSVNAYELQIGGSFGGAYLYANNKINGGGIRLIKDDSTNPGTMTDFDGNVYTTVKIGTQVWMGQNLIVKHFNNGNSIPIVTNGTAWASLTSSGMCYYDNADSIVGGLIEVCTHDTVSMKNSSTVTFEVVKNAVGEIEVTARSSGATGSTGLTGPPGANGTNGAAIELQKTATEVQWRVVGATTWITLIALSDLKGAKGDPGLGSVYSINTIGTNTQAVVSSLYILTASLILTLPASPIASDVVNISNQSATLTCVIERNGKNIMGLAENLTVDRLNAGFKMIYTNSTYGWVII